MAKGWAIIFLILRRKHRMRIAATNTISVNNFPSYMFKKFHRPLQ
jgi:hypothetical protein